MSRRSKLRAAAAGAGLVVLATTLLAHDLFIKLDTYFLTPGAAVQVPVLNGTFSSSENAIDRGRIADLSLVTPAGRSNLDTLVVSARGDSTFVALRLGGTGNMPLFGPDTVDQGQMDSIVRYVQALQHPEDRGGLALGHIGPIAEGFIAWAVGLLLLIVFTRWIGTKAKE